MLLDPGKISTSTPLLLHGGARGPRPPPPGGGGGGETGGAKFLTSFLKFEVKYGHKSAKEAKT